MFLLINICSLEFWYYRILILMTGYLEDSTLAVDALSVWYKTSVLSTFPCFILKYHLIWLRVEHSILIITIAPHLPESVTRPFNFFLFGFKHCSMTINGWELMIHLAFLAGTGYHFFLPLSAFVTFSIWKVWVW